MLGIIIVELLYELVVWCRRSSSTKISFFIGFVLFSCAQAFHSLYCSFILRSMRFVTALQCKSLVQLRSFCFFIVDFMSKI